MLVPFHVIIDIIFCNSRVIQFFSCKVMINNLYIHL